MTPGRKMAIFSWSTHFLKFQFKVMRCRSRLLAGKPSFLIIRVLWSTLSHAVALIYLSTKMCEHQSAGGLVTFEKCILSFALHWYYNRASKQRFIFYTCAAIVWKLLSITHDFWPRNKGFDTLWSTGGMLKVTRIIFLHLGSSIFLSHRAALE